MDTVHFGEILKHAVAWDNFEQGIRKKNRYSPDAGYLDEILTGAAALAIPLDRDMPFFRARIMPVEAVFDAKPLPFAKMGAPPPERCRGSRLNPEGIPYLYLATDADTAIAEVRPWRAAKVTVATMKLSARLKVVDLRESADNSSALGAIHWTGYVLSRPVHEEDALRYAATQLIAESLKASGFNGVLYPSALNPSGNNLALFDPSHAQVVATELREVLAVDHTSMVLPGDTDVSIFNDDRLSTGNDP